MKNKFSENKLCDQRNVKVLIYDKDTNEINIYPSIKKEAELKDKLLEQEDSLQLHPVGGVKWRLFPTWERNNSYRNP